MVLCARGGVHLLRRRHAHVATGRLVRVRPQGRAAHLHRRNARGQGAGRLPALPVRGLSARSGRTCDRTSPAAAARDAPRHGTTDPDRLTQRDGHPRTARPTPRPLTGQPTTARPLTSTSGRAPVRRVTLMNTGSVSRERPLLCPPAPFLAL